MPCWLDMPPAVLIWGFRLLILSATKLQRDVDKLAEVKQRQ